LKEYYNREFTPLAQFNHETNFEKILDPIGMRIDLKRNLGK